jgi:hypothetical protein
MWLFKLILLLFYQEEWIQNCLLFRYKNRNRIESQKTKKEIQCTQPENQ